MLVDSEVLSVGRSYVGHRDEIPRNGAIRCHAPLAALRALATRNKLRVLFFSKRSEFFDFTDLRDEDQPSPYVVEGFANERELLDCQARYDLAIVANSLMSEHLAHLLIRERSLADVIVAWTLDNHHHADLNRAMIGGSDIVLPAHDFASNVFDTVGRPLGRSFALPTGQWTRALAFKRTNFAARSNALYGGYFNWSVGGRGDLLRALVAANSTSALQLLDPTNRGSYFDASAAERFDEWSRFKTHLALPLLRDLSCRLFDSLICGQVPLVPRDCPDLDHVIPPSIQEELPVIRFEEDTPDAVAVAHARAIERFDAGGEAGVARRRDFAIRHHHIAVRLHEMIGYVHTAAHGGARSTLTCDDFGMRWRLDDPALASA